MFLSRLPHPAPLLIGLLALLTTLLPLGRPLALDPPLAALAPRVAQAQSSAASFGSAVPCLAAPAQLVTTCTADTIFRPPANPGSVAAAPALVRFTRSEKTPLLSLGQLGSTYGLAYDDGGASGRRRLFIGAFAQRFAAYGPGGPGAIYAYDLASGALSLFAQAPNLDRHGTRASYDREMGPWVGKSGLGDLELSPDGARLYAMNLHTRSVAVFDAHDPARRYAELPLRLSAISADPAVQADLRPFGLEFEPTSRGRLLYVGLVDSAERPQATQPRAYVLVLDVTRPESQFVALSQDLLAPEIASRFANSASWKPIPAWYKWGFEASAWGNPVRRPQPLLADIEFSLDGQTMLLGLRDRAGDQFWSLNPPRDDNHVVVAQGDTLAYRLSAGTWRLLTANDTVPSDYFNDNYVGSQNPPNHSENHGGALASLLDIRDGAPVEELVTTAITPFQGSTGGATWYGLTPYSRERKGATELIPRGHPAQGKAQRLGDLEQLCVFALIGDLVWKDLNRDGAQDAGEPPIAGVRLELWQGEQLVASATTDAAGRYRFAVRPGLPYRIRPAADNPALLGLSPTAARQPVGEERDSDLDPARGLLAVPPQLRAASTMSYDIGFVEQAPADPCPASNPTCAPPPAFARIGDLVWLDVDADGLQDSGEPGLPGVTVELLSARTGLVLASRQTDSAGQYLFEAPITASADYRVRVRADGPNATLLAGFGRSPAHVGTSDTQDSDADASGLSPAFALPSSAGDHSLDVGFVRPVDIAVAKTGPLSARPGELLTYSIAVSNTAVEQDAFDVTLDDLLPPGLRFVSASPAPDQVSSSLEVGGEPTAVLTWRLGRLGAGQTRSVRVTAEVRAEFAGTLRNTARVRSSSYGDAEGNNQSRWDTLVQGLDANLRLAKLGPAEAAKDELITYTLVYSNTGPGAAFAARVEDTFPPNFRFVSASPEPAFASDTRAVWYYGGDAAQAMPPATSATIHVRGRLGVAGAWTNSADVRTTSRESDLSDNRAQVTTVVGGPPTVNLRIDKTAPLIAAPDAVFSYNLALFETTGNRPAEQVVVSDTLPPGVTFLSATLFSSLRNSGRARPSQFVVNVSGQHVSVDLGTVPAAYRDTLRLLVRAPSAATLITNSASIRTSSDETRYDDNSDLAPVLIQVVPTSSIGDRVFLDVNGDGVRDQAVEPGLAGVQLDLYRYGSTWGGHGACAPEASAVYVRTTTSDSAGGYRFDDAIRPASQWGDLVVLPEANFAPGGALAGTRLAVYRYVGSEAPYDSNWGVYAELSPDGTCPYSSASEPRTFSYRRAGLPPGTIMRPALSTRPEDPVGFHTSGDAAFLQRYVADFGVVERWNLSVQKIGPERVLAGELFSYTISVANTRGDEEAEALLRDTLPAGMRFEHAHPAPNSVSGQQLQWNLALPAGLTRTIVVQVTTAPDLPGRVLENRACVETPAGEFDTGDNCGLAQTIVVPRADLAVAKHGPLSVTAGDLLTYTLAYSNAGPDVARGVLLTDTLPDGFSYLASSIAPRFDARQLSWDLGDVPVGASGAITLTVVSSPDLAEGQAHLNQLSASTTSPETRLDNNSASARTTIQTADLYVEKAGPAAVAAGSRFRYTLRYGNAGSAPARAVLLDDLLPPGLRLIAATGAPDLRGNRLLWDVGELPVGATGTLTVEVAADAYLPANTWLTNTASITSSTPDRQPGNNADSALTLVQAVWDLPLTKTVEYAREDGRLLPGALVTYTLRIANPGPSASPPAFVTDTFPVEQLLLLDAQPSPSLIGADGQELVWAVAALAPGAALDISLRARVRGDLDLPDGSLIINRARTSGPSGGGNEPPPGPSTPCRVPRCVVSPFYRLDLAVEKDDGLTRTTPGGLLSYRLRATNRGQIAASGVVLTEQLPAGLELLPGQNPGWLPTAEPGVVRYLLGSLAPGQTRSLELLVRVRVPLDSRIDELVNVVRIDDDGSHGPDSDPTNNSASDVNQVASSCIGDFVWLDQDRDATQDAHEPGIAGVRLELLDDAGRTLDSTSSDAQGRYRFCGLGLAADYRIRVSAGNFAAGAPLQHTTLVRQRASTATPDTDSDVGPTTLTTGSLRTPEAGDDLSVDVGVERAAATTDISPGASEALRPPFALRLPLVLR
jgi:uncharacterized repeat protein (TIGR01451 family)